MEISKYEPLTAHLRKQPYREIPCRFGELEKILGFELPSSARQHRAWWSNNGSNNVMTKAWLSAGFRTRDVDMENERLTFERVGRIDPLSLQDYPAGVYLVQVLGGGSVLFSRKAVRN